MNRVSPRLIATALSVALVLICLSFAPARAQVGLPVFLVLTIDRKTHAPVTAGTGFFVDGGGAAVTNSHVIWLARHDPARYQVVAVVGGALYGARVRCASEIDFDPGRPILASLDRAKRDVAEIVLMPVSSDVVLRLRGDAPTFPHAGPLPTFPVLPMGDPQALKEGSRVRAMGFGFDNTSPKPLHPHLVTGTIRTVGTLNDGTPTFVIASSHLIARQGDSGSPILDDANHVVGMLTWFSLSDRTLGIAIATPAFAPACP